MDSLLHRWLVEYNPLYLFSAALVLVGLVLLETAATRHGTVWGFLGVAALAELYAIALIGGPAFLVRTGHRRPAAMLGLLAIVFQGDVTMHVETCVWLGDAGKAAALAWTLLFAAKLYALAWALELRLSASAVLVPITGASGLALLPHVLRATEDQTGVALVSLFLFSIAAATLWTQREVASAVEWDARGRRCIRAVWPIWGALALVHALYMAHSYGFAPWLIAPLAPLLAARWARREWKVWALVAVVEALVAALAPSLFWVAALAGAICLCLTAWSSRLLRRGRRAPEKRGVPYRTFDAHPPFDTGEAFLASPRAKLRLLVGGLASAYLGVWTADWSGGELPAHILGLVLLVGGVCIAVAWLGRRPLLAWPVAPLSMHVLVQTGTVRTVFEWGALSAAVGFAALVVAILSAGRLSSGHAEEISFGTKR